ncbi:MAG: T9SS type A sorting domain-containing protein [Bacteroidota bacterium]
MKNLLVLFSILFSLSIKAQDCSDDTHSGNINDSWVSCSVSENPNPARGESHWVMYDLGYPYGLTSTHFWNYNVIGETENGMKNIVVDISTDGDEWVEAGDFLLNEATGNPEYQGETGIFIGQADVRYVLITAIDTWGGDCAGLSEVKFDIDNTLSVEGYEDKNNVIGLYPNPSNEALFIDTDWEIRTISIVNATGQEVLRQSYDRNIDISFLPNGIYHLISFNDSNEMISTKFIKQK